MKHLAAALALMASPVMAEDTELFVESNLLSIFYHELGHALIDIMQLPVFGQEEDAADVLSVLLIDAFYDEETAQAIAYDAAFGFLGEVAERGDEEIAYWGVHGPDEQRYYNLVCLFYGANPDERDDLAVDLGLPEERAELCEDEFALANDSWGPVLDEMAKSGGGDTIKYVSEGDSLTHILMEDEVRELNAEFQLPQTLTVRVEPCDEPNAFYDLSEQSITMCTEFEPFLRTLAPE
ncbi:DUF4344 domain-containing metallopeptidase [Cognatishimia sp. MH4019]|uniref:DUF4344 domain-containing metallopeptidase n=1 Tax=Cognatishimia sp. MH4019 TaxID=2854030 RepID=UPI001CD3DA97|nr:DUF4344 domain-containing metallopeptidase [Cognatishimia sp. MH4019]